MDAYKMNAAIAQFLDSFSNRDIAIWVWSIAFIAYLFVNKKFRGSLLRIIKCLLNIKLMIPIAGGLAIIVVVTYVLWKLNLWNVSILKDTIAYFFTANVVLFRYVGSNNRNFMEDALANVKATAIIAFYLNQASLNLIVELILVPVVVLLLLLQSFANLDKEKVDYKTKTCLNRIANCLMISLCFFSVWALIKGWKEYFTRNSILALLYPIIVNPLYLIYSYLVGVCCLYEVWFIRLNAFHNGRLPWEYRFFLFRQCGFCMNKIQYFSTHWRFCYMDCSDYDFLKSYRLVEEGYRETTKKK